MGKTKYAIFKIVEIERRCNMKEFVEKLIGRLEEEKESSPCRNTQCKECKYTNQCYEGEMCYKVCIDNIKEIVNQLAEENGKDTNVTTNNGWIPCSERLPEKPANYLVCSKGVVWMANYFNYTWWGVEKKIRWQDVEAWQPLPEPYQKGE
jgi:hypothetical protein